VRFIFSVSYFCLLPVDLNFSVHGLTQFQFARGFSLFASQRFGPVEISSCSLAILVLCAVLSPVFCGHECWMERDFLSSSCCNHMAPAIFGSVFSSFHLLCAPI
jgi:hypothetical protein